jgi:predicted nuclease with TOPRIM domain
MGLKGVKYHLKYIKSQMKQLIKENKELQNRLKEMMEQLDLEKNFALKALYHAEVAEGGKYQLAYQALDLPKG